MTKLKQIGSKDGGFRCDGCWYHNIVNTKRVCCRRFKEDAPCVIGKLGAKIIPGYEYMVLYTDLYPAFGGELSWFHGSRGIFTFTNELFTSKYFFNKDYKDYNERMKDAFEFDKYLLFEDSYVEWTPYDHPIYGEIEIGGFKRNYSRANPGFLLESDAHRNMAFTIFHA